MISSENSSGLVTAAIDWMMISLLLGAADGAALRDSSAVQFSTMTIVASAISPMAMPGRPARTG